jgi:predicted ATPase
VIPKAYTIGNFKAIGTPQTIQLKPINLIFGQNSAGKSSIIQSLLLCQHAMQNENFDLISVKRWGQTIDLGGFRQYVHRHDVSRDITLGFTFARTDIEVSSTAQESKVERIAAIKAGDDSSPGWSYSYFNFLENIEIRFSVGLSGDQDRDNLQNNPPYVKSITLLADGELLTRFTSVAQGRDYFVSELNLQSKVVTLAMTFAIQSYLQSEDGETLQSFAQSMGDVPEDNSDFLEIQDRIVGLFSELSTGSYDADLLDLLSSSNELARCIWTLIIELQEELKEPERYKSKGSQSLVSGRGLNFSMNKRLPASEKVPREDLESTGTSMEALEEIEAVDDPIYFFQRINEGSVSQSIAKALRFDFEQILEATFESLRWWLDSTEYIGPHRSIPDRFYQIAYPGNSDEIDHGYQTIRQIADDPAIQRRLSNVFQEILHSPYRIMVKKISPSLDLRGLVEQIQRQLEKSGSSSINDIQSQVDQVIQQLTEGRTINGVYLEDTRNGADVDFCDVGFGIGQVLPLLVEVTSQKAGLTCIEQPEAQLHPKMQSDLADIFMHESLRTNGGFSGQFILETHSEHLILRLLRRIRETTRNKLPSEMAPLTPDDISVMWVEAGKDGSVVTSLSINKQGQFTDEWPKGFFEERLDEMF